MEEKIDSWDGCHSLVATSSTFRFTDNLGGTGNRLIELY